MRDKLSSLSGAAFQGTIGVEFEGNQFQFTVNDLMGVNDFEELGWFVAVEFLDARKHIFSSISSYIYIVVNISIHGRDSSPG